MKDASGIPQHIRTTIAALAEVAPDLAGRVAAFASARTKRKPLPAAQQALLDKAAAIEIRHGRERLRAWTWGQGPTVHLVHGWNGHGAQLGAFVTPLVDAGTRVVAHDSVGHGASSGGSSSIVEMAESLARVVEVTGPGAIVAHSMGAAATAVALSRGLPAARATFIAAPAKMSAWPEDVFGLRGVAAERARFHGEARLRTTYDRIAMAALGRAIRIPVLVVHDRNDDTVPFEDALATVRSIRDAGLIATRGLGHMRVLRDQATIEEVVQFTAVDVVCADHSTEQYELERELYVRDSRHVQASGRLSALAR